MTLLAASGCSPGQAPDEPREALAGAAQALTCVTVQRGAYGAVEDTEIQEALPTTTGGGKAALRVGLGATATSQSYALFQFDLSFVPPGATVQSATMTLQKTAAQTTQTLGVHAVTTPWTEAALTWQSLAGAYDPAPFAVLSNGGTAAGPLAIDVTALAQAWVSGASPNAGVLVERISPVTPSKYTQLASSEHATAGWRPSLSVCYETASCTDGVQNQGEVGVDCGGPCAACGCLPGSTQACYAGPPGTPGVGLCVAGVATCDANGVLGPCVGEVLPARESCATPEGESCGPACGDHVWSLQSGDGTAVQAGEFVTADAAGDVYLTGSFMGSLDLGGGPLLQSASPTVYDGYLVKLTAAGAHLWSKRLGNGVFPQFNYGVAADVASHVVMTGMARGQIDLGGGPRSTKHQDVFLVKYDAAGNHLWSKLFGDTSPSQIGLVVAFDAASNIYLGSQIQGTVNFGGVPLTSAGDFDVAVAKLDPSGNHVWSRVFGGPGKDVLKEITVTASGEVILGGDHTGTIDFGGGPLVGPSAVRQGFVARLDAGGGHVWSAAFPGGAAGDAASTVQSVRLDPAGDLMVLGTFTSQIDLGGGALFATPYADASYLAKLGGDGAHVWSRAYQTTFGRLELTPSGDAFVAVFDPGLGSPNDLGEGSLPPGGALGKYDATGELVWSRWFGGGNPNGIYADAFGAVLVTGDITTSVDFGGGPLSTPLKQALFAAKLGDGDSYLTAGPCVVLPEQCNGLDDDCDGSTDEGLTQACYGGPPGTDGVGLCAAGVSTCDPATGTFGACVGEVLPAVESCASAADEDCDGQSAPACTGAALWTKPVSGASFDSAEAIAADLAGNVYATGWLSDTVDLGGGGLVSAGARDVFVVKTDPTGQHVWSQRFGGTGLDVGWGLAVDPAGNVVVAGTFQGNVDFGGGTIMNKSVGKYDVFVLKLDPAGQHLWSRGFGSALDDYAFAVAADAAGDVVVTGSFFGAVSVGGAPITSVGGRDIFVAKLDDQGATVWARGFGSTSSDYGYGVAAGPDGRVAVAGHTTGTIDFGAGPLVGAGNTDAFVIELDEQGQLAWAQRFGDANKQDAFTVAFAPDGDVVAGGDFTGTLTLGDTLTTAVGVYHAFIARFDPAGAPRWARQVGSAQQNEVCRSVAVDAAGDVLSTGFFKGAMTLGGQTLTSAGGYDVYVAKHDAAGTPVWARRFGDASDQFAYWVSTDAASRVLVAGAFDGSIDTGTGLLVSAGVRDGFLVAFAP